MGKGETTVTTTTDSDNNPVLEQSANENLTGDSHLQSATVHLLDASTEVFHVSKKAEGKELFDKVIEHLKLAEKDYFGLSYLDENGNRHWIYEDKRISRQLKGHPWVFNFEVKFYPPDPTALIDDLTRYYLTLQIRHDIYTGRIPATLATHSLLGSYVVQAERGDYEDTPDYDDFLQDCRLAPVPSATLYEKVRELHRQHKGETPAEAEQHYLDNAKKLSMYGVFLFPAKDSKGVPVQVGVCAHGIYIYCDQIRIHRFIWQNIIKIAYRRNTFTIKLQPGELDKNASVFVLKVPDYASAKRIWKCCVEHHTFFRLIQPDEKPHKGLFRWGSGRFRYQGRTHFQSKMASQMFGHPSDAVQRSHSARIATISDENVPPEIGDNQQTSPLHYVDDGTSREMTVLEKTYTLNHQTMEELPLTIEEQRNRMLNDSDENVLYSRHDATTLTETVTKSSDKKESRKKSADKKVTESGTLVGETPASTTLVDKESSKHILQNATGFVPIKNDEDKLQRAKEIETLEAGVLSKEQTDSPFQTGETGTTSVDETSTPHTTIESWHGSTEEPESVVMDIDKYGNVIKKTVKTHQVKHTIQRQTYQTYSTTTAKNGESDVQTVERSQQIMTPIGEGSNVSGTTPVIETKSHTVAFEAGQLPLTMGIENDDQKRDDIPGELISCRTITSGNRTVETITYKTEKDGIVEIHVEHRVTIHSGANIDHDAELSQAILEATNMNPDMTVEKIEVKQETQR